MDLNDVVNEFLAPKQEEDDTIVNPLDLLYDIYSEMLRTDFIHSEVWCGAIESALTEAGYFVEEEA